MAVSEPDQPAQRRLIHFTPLRYPGGKAKLAAYVKTLMKENRLLDSEYVEPYAGGAAVALELLFHEYVSRIHINDVSRPVHAFWKSVLSHTKELCSLIMKTPLTVAHWDKKRGFLKTQPTMRMSSSASPRSS
jgi:DNA adenine methylase